MEDVVKPMCIRREGSAVRQAARLVIKTHNTRIKISWNSFNGDDETERKFHLLEK